MKFTPKSDAEFEKEKEERLAAYQPWTAGIVCDYEINSSVEKLSKTGKDMIEIKGKIYNAKGESKDFTDYLGSWNEYRLKRICEAGGILERYEAGQVDDYDLVGKNGKCKIGIQKGAQKDDGSFYGDKNIIQEYLKPDAAAAKPAKQKLVDPELDDTIPF